MSSGFNTDVRAGERVFHVQTEDRGPAHPSIDTAVYHSGRVVHRLSTNYREFADSAEFSQEALRQRVQEQHKKVIESLRVGSLGTEIEGMLGVAPKAVPVATDPPAPGPMEGIQVQLQNPGSWLSAGNISLDLEILRRHDQKPEAGAIVEAMIEGALQETKHSATSDENGRAKIRFPLPPLGKGDLALVIYAKGNTGDDSIRFSMRTRAKAPETGSQG
ncbi:MAG TPA: hypothetical protein VMU43_08630 [Candidatus Acidoferrum sp.]|nr:hypothetical protein [Candidatus Acidoferrum sp.]